VRTSTTAVGVLGLAAALALMPTAARADSIRSRGTAGSPVADVVTSSECLVAMADAGVVGGEAHDACTWSESLDVSDARIPDAQELDVVAHDMAPSEARELLAARAAGAVRSKAYSYTRNNVSDRERIAGTFYYDGARAWVKSSYRSFTGSLRCSVDWAVGFDVSATSCADSGSTSKRQLTAVWKFGAGIKGSPISWSETQKLFVSASGAITK
jgi:hypothetical protein